LDFRSHNTLLFMASLMDGIFYLNHLNIAPVIPLIRKGLFLHQYQIDHQFVRQVMEVFS